MGDALATALTAAAGALGGPGEPIGPMTDGPLRYELFHAANSICSQKVRCMLAHHEIGYRSHQMRLFEGQTYLPAYVRLRMIGCAALGGALAAHHGGTTSTEAAGCDGAVVPTLIDHETGAVIVDSKRICLYLDARARAAARLRPAGLADAIDAELAIVDNLPNYQMLMGRTAKADAAASRTEAQAAFSRRKVAWCDRLIEEHGDDDVLVRAYTAKRAKELSAADTLFAPEAMQAAYAKAQAALDALEARLAARTGSGWLFGERLTMADLFWGIELLRMVDVGAAGFWEGGRLPGVERFAVATQALPAIRAAIIDWPGARF